MPRLTMNVPELQERALFVRRDIVALLARSQSGHSGGPLSSTDFGTVLFFHEMNVNPRKLDDPTRDLWHFSIGHVTPVIYSLMAERGYFPLVDLLGFRQFKGHLQGHPSKHDTPGIEVSSGSLGQGLSVASGMALGSRMDGKERRVYCVMGDGIPPSKEQADQALREMGTTLDAWTARLEGHTAPEVAPGLGKAA